VLIAADAVVAVTEPAYDSVRGVGRLEETVHGVARRGNPRLVIDKIVINRVARPQRAPRPRDRTT
jgi:cellulose biosynthesis protein BcsQ